MTLPRGANKARTPRQFQLILDLISEADRLYFESYTDSESYLRPYIQGEAWSAQPDAVAKRVTQVEPGIRVREILSTIDEGR